ncbi:hypothetical protein AJ78_02692 [Emergomyces pasteurianus Ep9510]|uniref:Alpha/beta hydrolase fold-3 domain-containing protein n=1 Tax=Emergomyces pasteurianus Ep9510 TaxID=1447872 RepID=A0A1J9QLZ5_9EURO|nr:hypothetical protein AJ78_02692 [Emergomyces pasteurianus Ep9510]
MHPQFASATVLLVSICFKHGLYFTICRRSYRNFSSSSFLSRSASPVDFRETTVRIPVGSSGNIFLNVLQPITQNAVERGKVILYLPPGPLFPNGRSDEATCLKDATKKLTHFDTFPSPQHALSSTTLSTVVTLNYRLGTVAEHGQQKCYYYPGPVHDTLAGFDWIFEHIKPKWLCVFGKHIGGSLAVMLALTEPRSVTAIAAHEPMCDWTSLDDYCSKTDPVLEKDIGVDRTHSGSTGYGEMTTPLGEQTARKRGRKKKSSPPDLVPLLEARSSLFRNPDNYFDSFASPALFLRSAGKDTPKFFPAYHTGPDYPIPVVKIPPKDIISGPDFNRYFQDLDLDLIPPPPLDMDSDSTDPEKPVRRRKALSRWPPYGLEYNDRPGAKSLGLWAGKPNLPHVRIFLHSNFTFELEQESASELTSETNMNLETLTTAYETWGEDGSASDSRADDMSVDTEGRIEFGNDSSTEETGTKPVLSTTRPRRPRTPRKRTLEADGETILARQGAEMVSLMRNACFWGREKGYAEERVKAVTIPLSSSTGPQSPEGGGLERPEKSSKGAEGFMDEFPSVEEQAGRYFYDILSRENGESE